MTKDIYPKGPAQNRQSSLIAEAHRLRAETYLSLWHQAGQGIAQLFGGARRA